MKLIIGFTLLTLFFSASVLANEAIIYIAQKGDTLSTIAESKIDKIVYAKQGSLDLIRKWNSIPNRKYIVQIGQKFIVGYADTQTLSPSTEMQMPAERAPSNETSKIADEKTSSESILTPPPAVTNTLESAKKMEDTSSTAKEIPHQIILSATYGMTSLEAVDQSSSAKAYIYSDHDAGLAAAWKQEWNDKFSSSFSAKIRSASFKPTSNTSKMLAGSDKINTRFSLTAYHSFLEKFTGFGALNYGKELFLRGMNSSTVTLEDIPLPSITLGSYYEFFTKGQTSLGAFGQFDYLWSASSDTYSVNAGTVIQFGAYLHRKYDHDHMIELQIGYKNRSQNTSIVDMHEKTVFATIIFLLPLFK